MSTRGSVSSLVSLEKNLQTIEDCSETVEECVEGLGRRGRIATGGEKRRKKEGCIHYLDVCLLLRPSPFLSLRLFCLSRIPTVVSIMEIFSLGLLSLLFLRYRIMLGEPRLGKNYWWSPVKRLSLPPSILRIGTTSSPLYAIL